MDKEQACVLTRPELVPALFPVRADPSGNVSLHAPPQRLVLVPVIA